MHYNLNYAQSSGRNPGCEFNGSKQEEFPVKLSPKTLIARTLSSFYHWKTFPESSISVFNIVFLFSQHQTPHRK